MDFEKVLRDLWMFCRQEDFPLAVIGAFGLHAYGLSRATQHLDFVVGSDSQAKLIAFMEAQGYETLHRSNGYSNHSHPDRVMGRVDFVYVSGETMRELLEGSGARLELGGVSIPVPRPEHLAAMKIHAMKNDPERRFREMADIQFLLGLPEVNEREVRSYFEKSGQEKLFEELKHRP